MGWNTEPQKGPGRMIVAPYGEFSSALARHGTSSLIDEQKSTLDGKSNVISSEAMLRHAGEIL